MKTALVAVLLAAQVFAGTSHISRGDLLKDRQYRTNADIILFVDPTGSDASACTSTGTAACLTIQGALNKAPKLLRHRLTVNVAAGNYAGATISGFTIDPSVQKTTAGISLIGALANVTPTTGSATGTATAGTAGSGSGATAGTLTDGAATWTVNDTALVGKFVTITGGTGSGQVRVIASNTATVLTIAGTWTAPTGTSTYALQSPSVNITSSAAAVPVPSGATSAGSLAAGVQVVDNVTGASSVLVRNVDISLSNVTGVMVRGGTGVVEILNVTTSTVAAPGILLSGGYTSVSVTGSSTNSTSGIGLQASDSSISATNNLHVTTTGSSIFLTGACTGVITGLSTRGALGLRTSGQSQLTTVGGRCDCASAANSVCLSVGEVPALIATQGPASHADIGLGGLGVTDCTNGILVAGPSLVRGASSVVVSGNALTYAVNVVHGGQIVLPTATTTITGGTAEISLDTGAVTGTWASLAASFSCISSLATGSKVCRL